MATTAEPQPATARRQPNRADRRQGLGHRRSRPAAAADGVRTPRAAARRCRDQDHLRRHLPQRPAHLPQRLGRHALPGDPRPRDRRHRHRGRQRSHPPPRRRHRRGRLHGRQLHGMRPVPRRLGSLLPQGLRPDLQQRRLSRRHDHARAATPTISSSATISCCKVPDGMDVSRVAPLLCAGITTYSPLRQYNVGQGTKMAVVGLGGLGHMGVKLGAAMGAHVTMITTTPDKGEDARKLGAHDVIISTDAEADARGRDALRFHPQHHPGQPRDRRLSAAARPLGPDGHRRRADADAGLHRLPTSSGGTARSAARRSAAFPRLRRCSISAPSKGIYPDVEMIRMDQVNEAYERLLKNDVRYRFVIDMSHGGL